MKTKRKITKRSELKISDKKPNPWLIKLPNIIYYLLFLFVFLLGIYIRFEDASEWEKNSNVFFHNGEPIYSEYDSFYFARQSLDMKEGLFKHGKIDNFRFFPDNSLSGDEPKESLVFKYSFTGNFLSFLFYILNQVTGISIPWLTYYLIPILASTIAIPIFFYFKRINFPIAGIFGGLVGLTSTFYLNRTCLMRLDHDVLNITLPFSVAYFFLRYFQSNNFREKVIWITLSSITLLFYYLWYAHSNLNFIILLTFVIAILWESLKKVFLKQPVNLRISSKVIILSAILILPQIWYIFDGPIILLKQIKNYVFNIKSLSSADILFKDFPNVLISISELRKENFLDLVSNTIYNTTLALLGLIGALLIFIFNMRNLIFLLPFFLIGLLVFISGLRFGMYLAPFIGIGLGYLIHLLTDKCLIKFFSNIDTYKQRFITALLGLALFIILFTIQFGVKELKFSPKITAPMIKEMEIIKEKTSANSAIWSWWDYGYAFQLYSRRTTFHDGGSQFTPKTYLIARSFVTSNPLEAWRITSFVTNYGLSGMAKILKEGIKPVDLIKKISRGDYEKPIEIPVYWVLTRDIMFKFRWIHYFGSFDLERKEGIFANIWSPICRDKYPNNQNIIECPQFQNALIDFDKGTIKLNDEFKKIKNLYLHEKDGFKRKVFNDKGFSVAIVKGANQSVLVIAESPSDETLFFEMFVLRKYDPLYFELVYDNFPFMVLYKVKNE